MKKPKLSELAGEFETIDTDTQVFYNTETGEVYHYCEDYADEGEGEKYEDKAWVAAPDSFLIGEYDMMVDFAEKVSDIHKQDKLLIALQGKGAFRRFKDTLHYVELTDEWYAFKKRAYVEISRNWCEEMKISYIDDTL